MDEQEPTSGNSTIRSTGITKFQNFIPATAHVRSCPAGSQQSKAVIRMRNGRRAAVNIACALSNLSGVAQGAVPSATITGTAPIIQIITRSESPVTGTLPVWPWKRRGGVHRSGP
jgi:hypothetical protein